MFMSSNQNQKTIVITGCSSGIGYETAITCAKNNFQVFACLRFPEIANNLKKIIEEENLSNLKIITMDLSDSNSIYSGINDILNQTDHIDILFNNAGMMIMGSLEDLSESELEKQLKTDLIGLIHLTKKIIPVMRKNNSGLIINMSSIAGRIGFSQSSAYCVSKFGIEGLSQSLRRELITKNISVCLIEAGIVDTNFFKNMKIAKNSEHSVYAIETSQMREMMNNIPKSNFTSPKFVADLVLKIIDEKGKKFRYVVGNDAHSMIAALEDSLDDQNKMDIEIQTIMKKWIQ